MKDKKYKWHKLADSIEGIEWNENNLAIAEVAGKKITIARIKNEVFACAYKCPHAGGILSEGFIDQTESIVCPVHRYRFNLRNGRNVSGEGYYLKTFGAEIREDGVYIGFEEKNLFDWI